MQLFKNKLLTIKEVLCSLNKPVDQLISVYFMLSFPSSKHSDTKLYRISHWDTNHESFTYIELAEQLKTYGYSVQL